MKKLISFGFLLHLVIIAGKKENELIEAIRTHACVQTSKILHGSPRRPIRSPRSLHVDSLENNHLVPYPITPLMAAVICKDHSAIGLLLDAQADVNIKNEHGKTALFYTTDLQILTLLIAKKADCNIQDCDGNSVLLHHIENFHADTSVPAIVAILRYGANPDMQNNAGQTPLLSVIRSYEQQKNVCSALQYVVILVVDVWVKS